MTMIERGCQSKLYPSCRQLPTNHTTRRSPFLGRIFAAAQLEKLHAAAIHAKGLLCIENLTTFHEYIRSQDEARNLSTSTHHATICLMGNPSPHIRRLLKLVSKETTIFLWADMDYKGFNILAQLQWQISPTI